MNTNNPHDDDEVEALPIRNSVTRETRRARYSEAFAAELAHTKTPIKKESSVPADAMASDNTPQHTGMKTHVEVSSIASDEDADASLIKSFFIWVVALYIIAMIFLHFSNEKRMNEYQSSGEYTNTFYGYECIGDCSGHEAGYNWAKEEGIEYASDCSGNSNSFTEGCEAWVKNSPDPFPEVRE